MYRPASINNNHNCPRYLNATALGELTRVVMRDEYLNLSAIERGRKCAKDEGSNERESKTEHCSNVVRLQVGFRKKIS